MTAYPASSEDEARHAWYERLDTHSSGLTAAASEAADREVSASRGLSLSDFEGLGRPAPRRAGGSTVNFDALRIGSLCSGVGGLDLAVTDVLDAGLTWYAQHEPPDKNGREDKNQYAAQIMAHHWPGVPNHGDITAIDYSQVEPVDMVIAGWPCQDMSLAGLRRGLMPGTRSGLWKHVVRAIRELRPSLVLLENVRSLTSARAHSDLEPCPWCLGDGRGEHLRALGCVLGDLADLGFDAEWTVIPASAVGAPHKRERCFVLAWPAAADPADVGHERGRLARGGRPGPEDGHLDGVVPSVARGVGSNAPGDGRDEGRSESAGQFRGPDAAERGGATAPDADGLVPRNDCELPARRDTVRHGLRADAPRCGTTPADPDSGRRGSLEHDDVAWQSDVAWGDYEAAIRRWEAILGRRAPRPTDDRGRLAPPLPEWMMGLPDGHVTAVPGIPRAAQLKGIGNGVVRQQGAAALRILLERAGLDWRSAVEREYGAAELEGLAA